MNRILIGFAMLAGLSMPVAAFSVSAIQVALEVSELPWSTVSKVLEAVTDVRPYSYAQLVDWYQVGRVTVEPKGTGYEVRILNDDGLLDINLIEGL